MIKQDNAVSNPLKLDGCSCRALQVTCRVEFSEQSINQLLIYTKKNKSFCCECWKHKILSTCKPCKAILTRFISLMEMETLLNCSDSEAVVATCSRGINKPVADHHLLAISASEYLLNFSLSVNICQRDSIWLTLSVSWDTLLQHADS